MPKASSHSHGSPSRPGSASTIMLVVAAAAAGVALLFSSPSAPSIPSAMNNSVASKRSMLPAVSRRSDLSPDQVFRAAGLTPDALAAVGATTDQVSALVAAGRAHLTQHGTALSDAMRDFRSARQQVSDLEGLAQSGRATQEQLTSLASARTTAASTLNTLQLAQAALISAATAGLSDAQKGALSNIRAARGAGIELPLAFLVTVRSEADQLAIRNALAESRIAAQAGEDVSEDSLAVLAAARQDAATSQAETDSANHTTDDLAAWLSALQ